MVWCVVLPQISQITQPALSKVEGSTQRNFLDTDLHRFALFFYKAIRLAFDDNREDNTNKSRSYAPLTQKKNRPDGAASNRVMEFMLTDYFMETI